MKTTKCMTFHISVTLHSLKQYPIKADTEPCLLASSVRNWHVFQATKTNNFNSIQKMFTENFCGQSSREESN